MRQRELKQIGSLREKLCTDLFKNNKEKKKEGRKIGVDLPLLSDKYNHFSSWNPPKVGSL